MKRLIVIATVILLLLSSCYPAFAATFTNAPVYITTSDPNSGAISGPGQYVVADRGDGAPPPYVVSVKIAYAGLQSGDDVSVIFLDYADSVLSEENVSSSGSTISAPSNTWKVKLHLVTGSGTATRWVWFSEGYNTDGNTTIFEAPDTSGGEPTPDPTPDPTDPTCDLTPVVTELQTIQGQLTTVMSGVDGVNSRLDTVSDRLNSVISELGGVNDRLDTTNSRLNSVIDRLDGVNDRLDTIHNYFSTPRTASPINVDLPNVPIDPTPPVVEEPYREPYNYNRPQPSPPPTPVDSPGPLPLAPGPEHYVLEHDDPATVDPPGKIDPPTIDEPLERDPVTMDPPASIDPPMRDEPQDPDPVVKDPPATKDEPLGRDTPLTPDVPIGRDAPLAPDPPLNPDPPAG